MIPSAADRKETLSAPAEPIYMTTLQGRGRDPFDIPAFPTARVKEGWLVRNASWVKTVDRIILGLVVLVAGVRKFFPGSGTAYVAIIEAAGSSWWSQDWASLARADPLLFVGVVGGVEVTVGALTALGLLRKPAFLLGIGLGVWPWAVPEGMSGFSEVGRLEASAGIFLAICYVTLSILEATFGMDRWSVDWPIARFRPRWLTYADFYTLINPLPPPEVSVAFLPFLERERRMRAREETTIPSHRDRKRGPPPH